MTIEELQEQLLKQQEENAKIIAQYEELKSSNEKLFQDNSQLRDYNNKLFMRVAEPVEEKPKELTPEEVEAQEIEKIKKLMEERK